MSDGSFPPPPPPAPPPPPPVTRVVNDGGKWWQSWWLITLVAVVLVVGAAALIAARTGRSDDVADVTDDRPVTEVPPRTSAPPATDAISDAGDITPDDAITPAPTEAPDIPPATDVPTTTSTDPTSRGSEVVGAPPGSQGDRASPVPSGEIADIGEGWRLQVLGVIDDATDIVLAENPFNDPPLPGTKFTFVRVALGYYGLDDPANAFQPNISAVGSASLELDEGCGVIPGDFRSFADVFSGGVEIGTFCYTTTPADDGTIRLVAQTHFDGPEVFVEAVTGPSPSPMPTLPGPQQGAASTPARIDPIPIGMPVEVGEGWTLTVTAPAADITDLVATENQFNDPPPDGFRFVGIDVEFLYDGDGVANAFEVSAKTVGSGNTELDQGCGVIPNDADLFDDVVTGGSVSGTICFVTPVADVGGLVLYTQTAFDAEQVFFATG